MKNVIKLILVALPMMLGLSSCLDEGEETFVLEQGNIEELIQANWNVGKVALYDTETGVYLSDVLNDPALGYTYILDLDEGSTVIDPEDNGRTLVWSFSDNEKYITLNGSTFYIESLGKELMVLSRTEEVNGEYYIVKYYLNNRGNLSNGEDEGEEDDETYVVSTDNHGYFRRAGYGFNIPTGAVPKGDNGQNGSVAFSAQGVPLAELPANAPSGVRFVDGSAILANPTSFTFASPIVIDVPLNGVSLENAVLMMWDAVHNKWVEVPFSSMKDGNTARISTLELGYFVLAERTSGNSLGGIKINKAQLSRDYIYYLTLTPANGSSSSSIAFSAQGEDLYMSNLPLQNYHAQITREKRTSLNANAASIETATTTFDVNVRTALQGSGSSFASLTGWTVIDLGGVLWQAGRPSFWADETVTYGTGTFQATLTWINYSGQTTDYDLHLTTPNSNEVYYANRSADGFTLDRDMISELGNCVENIFSVSENLPAGTYKVRVHHYGGATGRQYSCRVILNGRVVTVYSGVTNSGYQDIYNFTLR